MLKDSASTFPAEFASYRVLPSLISALEFEGASASAILPLVLQLGNNVSPEDYPSVVLAPIIKLFANPDRGTRMALLDHLPKYADKLDKKAVANKIWPHLVRRRCLYSNVFSLSIYFLLLTSKPGFRTLYLRSEKRLSNPLASFPKR